MPAEARTFDADRLVLHQIDDVGVLYTSLSGLMQQFMKNTIKPVQNTLTPARPFHQLGTVLAHAGTSEERVC